ncbi:MAG: hypothetical protein SGILL_003876 [Bacillariaceae sp.]
MTRWRGSSWTGALALFVGLIAGACVVQLRLFLDSNEAKVGGAFQNDDAPERIRSENATIILAKEVDISAPAFSDLEWKDGCLAVRSPKEDVVSSEISSSSPKAPPSGLVVTMALAPKNRQHLLTAKKQICNNLPNQWQWFLYPQGIDFLLVIQEEPGPRKRWTQKDFAECLELSDAEKNATGIPRSWKNLDGTTMEALEYSYVPPWAKSQPSTEAPSLSPIKIFVATTKVRYPPYIRNNPSLLGLRQLGPPGCSARLTYLQGCRWYTQEMLHLRILKEYDYFFKIDTDIIFHNFPSFHVLQDMRKKGAVLGHTAEYPEGDGSCAIGILDAIQNFTTTIAAVSTSTQRAAAPTSPLPSWKGTMCSSQAPQVQRDADQYYCNFIIGRVDYFTSPWVLQFANFLSNHPNGFFRQKWGDQIYWHFAMGLFLDGGNNSNSFADKYVVDYTDLRCKANPSCWFSSMDHDRYGANATEQCNNERGIFVHSKSLEYAYQHTIYKKRSTDEIKSAATIDMPQLVHNLDDQPLFQSIYRWNCT